MKAKITQQTARSSAREPPPPPPPETVNEDQPDLPQEDHSVSEAAPPTPPSERSARSKTTSATESIPPERAEIVRLQKELISKLGKPQGQKEKDAFFDYIKTVAYGFSKETWISFQMDMTTVLQKHQQEAHQQQNIQQQQEEQQSSDHCWQPHPNQWPTRK